jgi:cbb3-type cytochrome oxidase subunit 3
MKNKLIFGLIIASIFFSLSYNFSLAAGCCVKTTTQGLGSSNCVKNVADAAACTKLSAKGSFEASEPNCDGAGTKAFCGSSTSSNSASTATSSATEFPNPLKYTALSQVLTAVLVNLQSFLAIIAIIIIIIGGIFYMFSAGNESTVTKAKTTIGGALIGLAIILAAPSFLKQIKLTFGGGATGTTADEIVNKAYTVKDIAISVLNFLLSTIGILGIIALIVGGVMYVTAYGSQDRIDLAKKIITSAVVGIAVAFGALILVKQVAALLGLGT